MTIRTSKATHAPWALLTVTALAASAFLGWSATDANAALACGDTISADTKLKKDLLNCADEGLRFAAPDIELDLNGHKITGSGTAGFAGIKGSYDGIRIVGPGTVKGFDTQVELASSVGSTVKNLKARGGDDGIALSDSSDVKISRVKVRGYKAAGISLRSDSNGIRVQRSKVFGPLDSNITNTAINVVGGEDNTLAHNTLVGTPESTNGVIVRLSASRTRIESNSITSFDNNGVHLYEMAADTRLIENELRQNATGIRTSDVAGAPTGTKIVKNVASNNAFDGIELNTDGSSLRKNVANNNGAWGIFSAGSSIDLGGNKAKGNGQPAQCSGIVCG